MYVHSMYFLGNNKLFIYLGRHAMYANQESDTHNLIAAGCRVSEFADKPVSEENRTTLYVEESLGVETEKPLFLQPG